MIIKDSKFVGFTHSESNTSAEVFVTLMETVGNVLEATVNRDTLVIGNAALSPLAYPAQAVLSLLSPDLVSHLALTLKHLEYCEHHVASARDIFSDHHMVLYKKYFPRRVDDQVRRRMREVEASICRVLCELSKDPHHTMALLVDREVLQGLLPLAVSETRNSTAYVHAATTVVNILHEYRHLEHMEKPSMLRSTSLLNDHFMNR